MKKIAVVLAGCGVNDGSEIHEAVATLLAITRNGAKYECFAPDKKQHHVIDHAKGAETGESRNVMTESARIARGDIKPLAQYNPANYDALVFPGGFGAAKNLCNFAFEGTNCEIDPLVKDAILKTNAAGKPVGAMCIAPVLVAKAFEGSGKHVKLTIGNDSGVAGAMEGWGAKHENCPVDKACVDRENKIVSAPAYMLAQNISEAAAGIEDMIKNLVKMA